MPAISASAPGKIILFGEHAVVYGHPAIAVPLAQVRAKAIITANPRGKRGEIRIEAPNIDLEASFEQLPAEDPLRAAIQGVLEALEIPRPPALTLRVTSTIPVAAGLGSSAAISVAIIRALSNFLGQPLADEEVSELAYQVERIHHGTPSGIDNTVTTYAKPVFFRRGPGGEQDAPIETFRVAKPFTIVIGDTGVRSATAVTVSNVRRARQGDPMRFAMIFDAVEKIVNAAREGIESGHTEALGPLMDENHQLLRDMGVSSRELNRLVKAARAAGALGAKLSGGGGGGNMIALTSDETAEEVAQALVIAGARGTIVTRIVD
jgi:mevalonate kinase